MTAPPILSVVELSKHFDGLIAVNAVSLEAHTGEVHAVIGPNGAGKTTLIDLFSGDRRPTSGSILFEGHDIAGLPAHRISQLGVSRSYQKTNIFPSFTVFENCRLAAQSRLRTSRRFFRAAKTYGAVNAAAERALEMVSLARQRDSVAGMVSHGEQRQLEIAMALATRPKVLLLDEPLAGMGAEESAEMTALIARLAPTHAILLVEHEWTRFSVAHRLTVTVNGRVLATGAPHAIRQSKAVQEAYLGVEEAAL